MSESMLEEVARLIRERAATVHERHACPKCGAPRGQACRRFSALRGWQRDAPALRHSHVERVQIEVPLR